MTSVFATIGSTPANLALMKVYLCCIFLFVLSTYSVKKGWMSWEEECQLIDDFPEEPRFNIPDLMPVSEDVRVSSYFGMRIHPVYKKKQMHWGIDFPLPIGTPIRAAADGIVQKTLQEGKKSSYGKHIQIGHDHVYSSLYAHLSKVYVTEGQMIQRGDTIGLSGNTGVTTGPHLHFEVFKNGIHVNPLAFWQKR